MSVTERATQGRSARWWSCAPTQNLIGPDRPPVIAGIGIPLRSNHCAFQGDAGKETLALAVGVNCSRRCDCAFRSATHWACSGADIRSDRDVSSPGKCSDGAVIIENDHEIRHLRTDLKAPSRAACADQGWARPAMPCPSDHNALAALAAKNNCGFDDAPDREPVGMSPHL